MNVSKVMNDVNPRLMNLIKKDNTQKIGNAVMERLPNEYKIFTYPNGKQTVIDAKGNIVLTQITENGKIYLQNEGFVI